MSRNDEIKFSGYLDYDDDRYFFTTDKYRSKIFPYWSQNSICGFQDKFDGRSAVGNGVKIGGQDIDWKKRFLFGQDGALNNFAVCAYRKPRITSGISASFPTPIIVKGTKSNIRTFKEIRFVGESINIINNPTFALDVDEIKNSEDGSLVFKTKPRNEIRKEYDVFIKGTKAKLVFSMKSACKANFDGSSNSFLEIDAYISISFEEPQQLVKIEDCSSYVASALVFLTGRQNVGYKIELKNGKGITTADVYINVGEDDYCDEISGNTISMYFLGDRLPNLFALLADEETRPFLNFLPLNNKAKNHISYSDMQDIWTSLEREYIAHGRPNNIKEKFKMVWFVVERSLANDMEKNKKEKTKQQVVDFYGFRNKVTHEGRIVWENHIDVYNTLLRAVYYSVFVRAGYSEDDAKQYAKQKWQRE